MVKECRQFYICEYLRTVRMYLNYVIDSLGQSNCTRPVHRADCSNIQRFHLYGHCRPAYSSFEKRPHASLSIRLRITVLKQKKGMVEYE